MEFSDYEEYILSKSEETNIHEAAKHRHKQVSKAEKAHVISWLINGGCALIIYVMFHLHSSGMIEMNGFTALILLMCILRLGCSLLTSIKW